MSRALRASLEESGLGQQNVSQSPAYELRPSDRMSDPNWALTVASKASISFSMPHAAHLWHSHLAVFLKKISLSTVPFKKVYPKLMTEA